MKISAGCALYHRKPIDAPVIAPQKIVNSRRQASGRDRDTANSAWPLTYDEYRHGARSDDHQPDREPIQPIREIHKIRRPAMTSTMKRKKNTNARGYVHGFASSWGSQVQAEILQEGER